MPAIGPRYRAFLPALLATTTVTSLLPVMSAGEPTPTGSPTPAVATGSVIGNIAKTFGLTRETPAASGSGALAAISPFGSQTPPASGGSSSATPKTHLARPGDTLSSIAQRYGTTVESLMLINGIKEPNVLMSWQRIALPPPRSERSVLEKHRLVTYYGVDGNPSLGVLGQLKGDELVRSVKERAAAVTAQGGKVALPTLHLVVAQAMAERQKDGTYRRRVSHSVIQRYVDLARNNGLQLILDHHIAQSNLAEEIAYLRPYLELPFVHLALDPEWATEKGVVPGTEMGSIDAKDINMAVQALARISEEKGLPNKVLLVHYFRPSMINNRQDIVNHPAVDLVISMDGFGPQDEKTTFYKKLLGNIPNVFKGMQIFLRLDPNPFTPAQALALNPTPDVIVYL